jgi:DNA-binding MarR family transcriptional regulator
MAVSRSTAKLLRRHLPDDPDPASPLVGALLRFAWNRLNARLFVELASAGFEDIKPAHLTLLRFPAPEGERPTDLAKRTGVSKQALNHTLGQLAELGYLERARDDGRVTLTARGWEVAAFLRTTVRTIEREWRSEIGPRDFDVFMRVLRTLAKPTIGAPAPDPRG